MYSILGELATRSHTWNKHFGICESADKVVSPALYSKWN